MDTKQTISSIDSPVSPSYAPFRMMSPQIDKSLNFPNRTMRSNTVGSIHTSLSNNVTTANHTGANRRHSVAASQPMHMVTSIESSSPVCTNQHGKSLEGTPLRKQASMPMLDMSGFWSPALPASPILQGDAGVQQRIFLGTARRLSLQGLGGHHRPLIANPHSVMPTTGNLKTCAEETSLLSGTAELIDSPIVLSEESSHRLGDDIAALATEKENLLQEVSSLEIKKQHLVESTAQLSSDQQKLVDITAQLSSEKQQLEDAKATLSADQQKLANANAQLSSEKEHVMDASARLTVEQDKLWVDCAQLAVEKEQLLEENAKLATERKHSYIESSRLTEEKLQLVHDKAKLDSEKQRLVDDTAKLHSEREQLLKDSSQRSSEKQRELDDAYAQLATEKQQLVEDKNQLTQAEQKLAEDNTDLASEREIFATKKKEFSIKKRIFREDRAAHETQRQELDERDIQLKMREAKVHAQEIQLQSQMDLQRLKSIANAREVDEKAESDIQWAQRVAVLDQRVSDLEAMLKQEHERHVGELHQLRVENDELLNTVNQYRAGEAAVRNSEAENRRSLKIPEPPLSTCFAALRLI
eukprot:GEMP01014647.1.p1 GENE.GEMP01014647.1~~GEMP01014647.1.p1  ORF type:complete len:585 (+),score=121.43 GEMP01014647.1:46-1800(+)